MSEQVLNLFSSVQFLETTCIGGVLRMTDTKITDHQNCRAWICRTWNCRTWEV